jgi:hypothetical protein
MGGLLLVFNNLDQRFFVYEKATDAVIFLGGFIQIDI